MTTLHMEVETVRNAQTNMVNAQSQMAQSLQSLTSQVQGVVGSAWIGNSATEFLSQFDQWRSSMNSLLEQLNTLASHLQSEIQEWEAMAAKF